MKVKYIQEHRVFTPWRYIGNNVECFDGAIVAECETPDDAKSIADAHNKSNDLAAEICDLIDANDGAYSTYSRIMREHEE